MGKKKRIILPPDSPAWANQTAFRIAERSWKRRTIPAQLRETLLDPGGDCTAALDSGQLRRVDLAEDPRKLCRGFGANGEAATAYAVRDIPGLVVIPGLFSGPAQAGVVRACLAEYTAHPNVTNLDTHWRLPASGLWGLYERERNGLDVDVLEMRHDGKVPSVKEEGYGDVPDQNATDEKVRIDPPTTATHYLKAMTASQALPRLRWTSLGFQYNWSNKTYHLDRHAPMPVLIDELCGAVVAAIANLTAYPAEKWKSEAGIVNFYQLRDLLMAHQDRSEENSEAPLVSFSFGNSCIFLIGTDSRDDIPTPILLRSGDVLVMHGASRRAFHSVPRILENTIPEYLAPEHIDDKEWPPFYEYLKDARVNVNVRQVF
ncbi:hypothetical protein PhCBS80983_g01326 [Powellomyces hirtus]|uniref:Fe2OG dioxygenase domain-containing protein n=1 Tax=Powellomyces hirtus TaxID=109895 RepID=A0A507ECF5_9FUNG|nr:hypothetical protein PhCBS80983_g01326 [Powellomyces hirtus]